MTFSLIPAIDIRDGNCVRLLQGEFSKETIFSKDPQEVAEKWISRGAKNIHIIDLDGASSGKLTNDYLVKTILNEYGKKVSIQVGGGIRDMNTIEELVTYGASRVIIGTAAVKTPEFLRDACRLFPGCMIVALDAKNDKVATNGWSELSSNTVIELAKEYQNFGVEGILYTDIMRDGMMKGVNLESTLALARSVDIPIIASGGVSGLSDLRRLIKCSAEGISGVILGRALYEGKLDFEEALQLVGIERAKKC